MVTRASSGAAARLADDLLDHARCRTRDGFSDSRNHRSKVADAISDAANNDDADSDLRKVLLILKLRISR
jgi:hypothetical protein